MYRKVNYVLSKLVTFYLKLVSGRRVKIELLIRSVFQAHILD